MKTKRTVFFSVQGRGRTRKMKDDDGNIDNNDDKVRIRMVLLYDSSDKEMPLRRGKNDIAFVW